MQFFLTGIDLSSGESMIRQKKIFLVLFTLLMTIGCDQITKDMVKSHLPKTKVVHVAGSVLSFDYHENKGAEFSFE